MIHTDTLHSLQAEVAAAHATLVAVSKTKPDDMILEAYREGQRDFGENYVQELVQKQANLPGDIRWHFIGHLQSNKVKQIAAFVHLIHGVDSFRLLQEIDKQAGKCGRVIDCLLQVHIASEETKFGLSAEEAETLVRSDEFRALQQVRIRGLMGMASNTADTWKVRDEFHVLGSLFRKLKTVIVAPENFDTLSMGMTGDYKIALQEGSTMIRIGSAIFGDRS